MDAVLDVIKRLFGWIVERLAAVVSWVRGKVRGENYINPTKLIRRVCDCAEEAKVKWPDFTDYPDSYTIAVDLSSWNNYYQGTNTVSSQRIADAIYNYVRGKNGTTHNAVKVTIVSNVALELGDVQIDCAFTDTPRRKDGRAEVAVTGMTVVYDKKGKPVEKQVHGVSPSGAQPSSPSSTKKDGPRIATDADGYHTASMDGRRLSGEEVRALSEQARMSRSVRNEARPGSGDTRRRA